MVYYHVSTRDVYWIGQSKDDLKGFPEDVQRAMGYALWAAQNDERHPDAARMTGELRGVMEVRANFDGETYRTMYTLKLEDSVYVLHAFQKRAKKGRATPKHELDLVRQRLRQARQHHQETHARK